MIATAPENYVRPFIESNRMIQGAFDDGYSPNSTRKVDQQVLNKLDSQLMSYHEKTREIRIKDSDEDLSGIDLVVKEHYLGDKLSYVTVGHAKNDLNLPSVQLEDQILLPEFVFVTKKLNEMYKDNNTEVTAYLHIHSGFSVRETIVAGINIGLNASQYERVVPVPLGANYPSDRGVSLLNSAMRDEATYRTNMRKNTLSNSSIEKKELNKTLLDTPTDLHSYWLGKEQGYSNGFLPGTAVGAVGGIGLTGLVALVVYGAKKLGLRPSSSKTMNIESIHSVDSFYERSKSQPYWPSSSTKKDGEPY